MKPSIHVAILGASGYGAAELLRLFTQHPAVRVTCVTSTTAAGEPIASVHPHLRGFYPSLTVSECVDFDQLSDAEHAVVFSALPNGTSAATIDALLSENKKTKVIDLSGDLRLSDAGLHEKHYPETPACADLRGKFVYGLPELFREKLHGARFVANPGCHATAAILAAAPLAMCEFAGSLVIDTKTGSSGSGRTLKETTHHPTRHADFRAYKPLQHQHEPEILQAFGDPHGERIQTSFVAQSMDAARGIFATVHLTLNDEPGPLRERYQQFYTDSPFVRVVDGSPALQNVVGSNFCDVSVTSRGRQVIAMAALDNLVKGMAGTAIQNMNLMCDLPETTGLWSPAYRPI